MEKERKRERARKEEIGRKQAGERYSRIDREWEK
jgi:hypothetical protein